MAQMQTTVKADVLVIGTGIAGCFAALKALDNGAKVVMVNQGKSGFSGMSTGGTHRVRVVLPEDDIDLAMSGTVRECEYMVDQDFLQEALPETNEIFRELIDLGAEFRRDEHGDIKWYWADTAFPEFKQRNAMWEPVGTYIHILKIKNAVVKRGVTVLDRIMLADLLMADGAVRGAVGFDTRSGDFYVFQANAVVVAAGGFSGGGGGSWPSLSGDGIAMGVRVGAQLRGMEFGKAETGGILPDRGAPPWVTVLLNPQDTGVTFTNRLGEEFLEKYELGRRVAGRKYYGPPYRVHLMAALKEIREGRGPCYVDYRGSAKEERLRQFWGSFFDRTVKQIKLTGTHFDKMKYELALCRGYNMAGGIRITPQGESSVPGLYAAGQSSDMCGVVQYCIMSGMMASAITAKKAGDSASRYALSQPAARIENDQVKALEQRLYAPLERKRGMAADELQMETIRAWVDVDIRNENRLSRAHLRFNELRKAADTLKASDIHELVKCHKASSYIECSDAVAVAARARKETRLEHIREDYPLTDNSSWLKWVIVKSEDGDLSASLEEIPMGRWKYRPSQQIINRLQPAERAGS
jgi:succinate dehydrogenase/fumarate reductase flavoprotein subunit